MQERLTELEARVDALERRLAVLEGRTPSSQAAVEPDLDTGLDQGLLSNVPTLVGRVLLIFGGAYLLRAITDSQVVPLAFGILLGAGYALLWLFMAWLKSARTGERVAALLYGGTSVLLALPLLVEATTRFDLLSGTQSVFALGVFCTVSLFVATRRDLRFLAWLVTAGGIATAFVVLSTSKSALSVSVFLLYLALVSLWVVGVKKWMGLQWLGAVGANVGVVVLAVLSTNDNWTVQPVIPFILAATMLVLYLFSFGAATHGLRRQAGLFESLQLGVTLVIVLVAADLALQAGQLDTTSFGLATLVLGAGTYGLALTREVRAVRGRNFYFYSAAGLALVMVGTAALMPLRAVAVVWSLMAVAMAWASGRFDRVSLSLQCTFLLLAAGVASGIFAIGYRAFVGPMAGAWPPFDALLVVVALANVACLFIPVAQRSERWGVMAGLPQLIVLGLSVWWVGGLMVAYSAPLVAGAGGEDGDAAVLATLRTGVLCASSLTLALSSQFRRWPEARWLVYPVLILVGLKLALEDFPNGRPATLFIALGMVGGALLIVAKLLRRGDGPMTEGVSLNRG